jgi:hypothetical protein
VFVIFVVSGDVHRTNGARATGLRLCRNRKSKVS